MLIKSNQFWFLVFLSSVTSYKPLLNGYNIN